MNYYFIHIKHTLTNFQGNTVFAEWKSYNNPPPKKGGKIDFSQMSKKLKHAFQEMLNDNLQKGIWYQKEVWIYTRKWSSPEVV